MRLPAVVVGWLLVCHVQTYCGGGSLNGKVRMKTTTRNGAALPATLNIENLKSSADFFRANWRKLPPCRWNLGKKLCGEAQPVVRAVAKKFGLTLIQARSVVVDAAIRRVLGSRALRQSVLEDC